MENELIKEMEAYEKKDSAADLSIQDALIILGIYAANVDPGDCQEAVRRIVELARQQPEFLEISEAKKSTEERIHRYLNMMKDPSQSQSLIDQAVGTLSADMRQRAVDWMTTVCNAIGLTEASINKLNDVKAKL